MNFSELGLNPSIVKALTEEGYEKPTAVQNQAIPAGRIDFSRLEVLVLDEADRMLDMGFVEDIEHIVARAPRAAARPCCSPPPWTAWWARWPPQMTRRPKRIEVVTKEEHKANIEQRLFFADDVGHKHRLLDALLRDVDLTQAGGVHRHQAQRRGAVRNPAGEGFAAAALHGDMPQHKAQPHPAAPARRPDPRAGGHRRGRARHRRGRHQPRHQLRRAAPGRGLRAPHRPHRPRRANANQALAPHAPTASVIAPARMATVRKAVHASSSPKVATAAALVVTAVVALTVRAPVPVVSTRVDTQHQRPMPPNKKTGINPNASQLSKA
jgi:hypothetical protein